MPKRKSKKPKILVVSKYADQMKKVAEIVNTCTFQRYDIQLETMLIESCGERYKKYAEATLILLVAVYDGRGSIITEDGESQYGELFKKRYIAQEQTFLILFGSKYQLQDIHRIFPNQPVVEYLNEKKRFFTLQTNYSDFEQEHKQLINNWILEETHERKECADKENESSGETEAEQLISGEHMTSVGKKLRRSSPVSPFPNASYTLTNTKSNLVIVSSHDCKDHLNSIWHKYSAGIPDHITEPLHPVLLGSLKNYTMIVIIAEKQLANSSRSTIENFIIELDNEEEIRDKCIFLLPNEENVFSSHLENQRIETVKYSRADSEEPTLIFDENESNKLHSFLKQLTDLTKSSYSPTNNGRNTMKHSKLNNDEDEELPILSQIRRFFLQLCCFCP